MEIVDGMIRRRSIRRFRSDDVPDSKIMELLELANSAPSAGNLQAREFIVVRKQGTKSDLADAALGQGFVAAAPVVIVVCGNISRSASHYGRRGRDLYNIQDADAAISNLLLAVTDSGLGACWVGAFDESEVSRILNLPSEIRPLAIIPIGVPEKQPAPGRKPNRLDLKTIVHLEKW